MHPSYQTCTLSLIGVCPGLLVDLQRHMEQWHISSLKYLRALLLFGDDMGLRKMEFL